MSDKTYEQRRDELENKKIRMLERATRAEDDPQFTQYLLYVLGLELGEARLRNVIRDARAAWENAVRHVGPGKTLVNKGIKA